MKVGQEFFSKGARRNVGFYPVINDLVVEATEVYRTRIEITDDNNRNILKSRIESSHGEHIFPICHWHHHIQQDEIRRAFEGLLDTFESILRTDHRKPCLCKANFIQLAQVFIIFDKQYGLIHSVGIVC